ncbi:hypothetical protein [Geomicrobium sp. JCM 19038]|uniref:hypothetical protein n=1 Tax=Geomicrobium sp. JCM 19038 TaxID=1460635 RepID=UPI00045F3EDC|nr:hypothetical protein [Geomicrobium sp. JCM 19038]GAK07667.1 hypothetical protein JCM19038_1409 [Geomicrobium sp. JCM 19038]
MTNYAIQNVTVIDGTGSKAKENQTVTVKDGKIEQFTSSNSTLDPSLEVIDGEGNYLLPGSLTLMFIWPCKCVTSKIRF